MKRNRIIPNSYFKYTIILLSGLFLGWVLFHRSGESAGEKTVSVIESHNHAAEGTVWTCAMHPQIRMDKPGKCPICGMDLIPLSQSGNDTVDVNAIHLSEEAIALANVQTSIVSVLDNSKEVRLYGKVQEDERLIQSQVSHIPGRIEKLYVNFTGENVRAGQPLAEIYSPDLVTAEHELLQTAETKKIQPELYEASRERLRQWKLSEDQINEIESSGSVISNFKILSNTSGTVTARLVNAGDHVGQGAVLFTVADLSKVWIQFDAYESDLSFLAKGKPVTFTLQSFPGKVYKGVISFIDPVVDPVTRVTRVRVEYNNNNGELKPEMFATGTVSGNLAGFNRSISIPSSAVLWTGKRSIVYVKQPGNNLFKMREVELGPALGERYIIVSGLKEGEEIVTNGTFSVDASAQLEGKTSMMNPTSGVKASSMPGMIMPGDENRIEQKSAKDAGMAGMDMPGAQTPVKMDVSMNYSTQQKPVSTDEILKSYLDLENALANDDSRDAAKQGSALLNALKNYNKNNLGPEQKRIFEDIADDLTENARHISENGGKIAHQREHFNQISIDMYDFVKALGASQVLYKVFCPMYNDGKGAYWLSDSREIKNPYFGKSMLTCGSVSEEIK